jgi:hypothetical protein
VLRRWLRFALTQRRRARVDRPGHPRGRHLPARLRGRHQQRKPPGPAKRSTTPSTNSTPNKSPTDYRQKPATPGTQPMHGY